MKPCIPPSALAIICEKSQAAQAEAIGLSLRHFERLIRRGWDSWILGRAERWCAACGVDFWNMQVANQIRKIDWKRQSPAKQRALRGILKMATGKEPTAAEVKALAAQLNSHG